MGSHLQRNKNNLLKHKHIIKHGILMRENLSYAKSQWSDPRNAWCKLQLTYVRDGPGLQMSPEDSQEL